MLPRIYGCIFYGWIISHIFQPSPGSESMNPARAWCLGALLMGGVGVLPTPFGNVQEMLFLVGVAQI